RTNTTIDVLSSNGHRYFVEFNEPHQLIWKGGHIFVKFLGYIAKMGNYCPVGALTYHNVEEKLKFNILKKMRPSNEWKSTGRHYKHELKNSFFQPYKKTQEQHSDPLPSGHTITQEQHSDPLPSGHTSNDWIKLVNYWFSPKGQKLSQIGKEALSLQCQTHIMGANSYANLRADYEAEHGKPMGLIKAWERSHVRKDGSFHDTKAKVETLKLSAPSTFSVEDLEDEAFDDVLNRGKIPKRPQGFGFGVKRSDVDEVRGLVRKKVAKKKKEDLEKRNEELSMKYNENKNLLKTVVIQFSEFLDVMHNRKALVQLIDAAQSTLATAIQ
ncbi:Ribosomal RNA small subunit methyltransferase C, partial [Bienertia sinuspersici]